jgi:hypothetical protein
VRVSGFVKNRASRAKSNPNRSKGSARVGAKADLGVHVKVSVARRRLRGLMRRRPLSPRSRAELDHFGPTGV